MMLPKSYNEKKIMCVEKIKVLRALEKRDMTIADLKKYVSKDIEPHVHELYDMGVIAQMKEPDSDWKYISTTIVPSLLMKYETYSKNLLDSWIQL